MCLSLQGTWRLIVGPWITLGSVLDAANGCTRWCRLRRFDDNRGSLVTAARACTSRSRNRIELISALVLSCFEARIRVGSLTGNERSPRIVHGVARSFLLDRSSKTRMCSSRSKRPGQRRQTYGRLTIACSRPGALWQKSTDPSEVHDNCAHFVLNSTSFQLTQAYSSQSSLFS